MRRRKQKTGSWCPYSKKAAAAMPSVQLKYQSELLFLPVKPRVATRQIVWYLSRSNAEDHFIVSALH